MISCPVPAKNDRCVRGQNQLFFELLAATEHGAELLDENNRLCGDISTGCKKRFHNVLVRLLQDAQKSGEIALQK
jgi:hypothetical protein